MIRLHSWTTLPLGRHAPLFSYRTPHGTRMVGVDVFGRVIAVELG